MLQTVGKCFLANPTVLAGIHLQTFLTSSYFKCCCFHSVAVPKSAERASALSSSQLIRLNLLGTLPCVARHWDSRTAEAELRRVDAVGWEEFDPSRSEPSAVQRELAQRHGVVLAAGDSRAAAATALAAVRPPSIRSLTVLYGVLGHEAGDDVPASDAAACHLIQTALRELPHPHPLDCDLSPVASSQMHELFNRLGYIGRLPYSYGSAQLMAACLRIILADVDDEARLRPLPGHDSRQAALIRYLRSRRAAPGSTRGMPAVLDVDLTARPPVSRLAAARNILQLLQNHELCAIPVGDAVAALRNLGHTGPVPPTTGEAMMLTAELRDRCLRPKQAHIAALRAAGYGSSATSPPSPSPDSLAHVKAILRVLRRADTEAATPATRTALRHLAEARDRTPASRRAAAAAAAAAPWEARDAGAAGSSGVGVVGVGTGVGPCPSQLEVRAAIEGLALSEQMMERLYDLGWPGPMPATHGSALALEDYLMTAKSTAAAASFSAAAAAGPGRHTYPPSSADTPATAAAAANAASAGAPADHLRQAGGQYGTYDSRSRQQQHVISRLGSSPEEVLTKIQIRGLFPGAVSEWYLPTMSYEEAQHVLACLMAARRTVLERASTTSYDEYVDRWCEAEAEGDWWGMELLWH